MPRLHFHPFCVLISTIHSFAIDINLMTIYWYFSITYLAECNYQQREADRCDVGRRVPRFVNRGEELLRAALTESNGSRWSSSKKRFESPNFQMGRNNQWKYVILTEERLHERADLCDDKPSVLPPSRTRVKLREGHAAMHRSCQQFATTAISHLVIHTPSAWRYELSSWSCKKKLIYVSMTRGS